MEVKNYIILQKNDPYFSVYTRALLALVAAIILIRISSGISYAIMIYSRDFYYSICFGFLMAFSVMEAIHWSTFLLDKMVSWQAHGVKRLVLQIAIGVVGVTYFNIGIVKKVYYMLKLDFEESNFMVNILPLNVVLIILTNCLFFFRRYDDKLFSPKRWWKKIRSDEEKIDLFHEVEIMPLTPFGKNYLQQPVTIRQKALTTSLPRALLQHHVLPAKPAYWRLIQGFIQSKKYIFTLNEVLCVSTGAVYGDIILKDGSACNMNNKKVSLRKFLDPHQFVEIRGGQFFALSAIAGIRKEGKKRSLILKPEYQHIKINKTISRRYFASVKNALDAY